MSETENQIVTDVEGLWFDRGLSAAICNMGTRNFDQTVRTRIGPDDVQGEGKTLKFRVQAVAAAYFAHRLAMKGNAVSDPDMIALLSKYGHVARAEVVSR